MIVYSSRTSACHPCQRLRTLAAADPLALLLELGALESAIADECPPLAPAFAAMLEQAANSWLRHTPSPCLKTLLALPLPLVLHLPRPEGFCDYAVTPESYCRAAIAFYNAHYPVEATVIGIRSIGTTLSAVVAAALQARHCQVTRYTVRPHGHPYHREVTLPPLARHDGWFLIVDEGPGRSGSSFAAVAAALQNAGVPCDHIVLIPANNPDPASLCSEEGRHAWRTYPKFQAAYAAPLSLRDAAEFPEGRRRKYICHDGPIRRVAKFAGLGPYGLAKLDLAQQLAEAGFVPRPRSLQDGFLISDWIDAPANPPVTTAFLDHLARYLACRAALPVLPSPGHSVDDLLEMVEVNYREAGLIPPDLTAFRGLIADQPPAAIDGRLGPDKWLSDGQGYVKLDAVDHHDDHFYPGPQDIAWDLAGAIEEFNLDIRAAAHLLGAFHQLHPTPALRQRVDFFQTVYHAFRAGSESMLPV